MLDKNSILAFGNSILLGCIVDSEFANCSFVCKELVELLTLVFATIVAVKNANWVFVLILHVCILLFVLLEKLRRVLHEDNVTPM